MSILKSITKFATATAGWTLILSGLALAAEGDIVTHRSLDDTKAEVIRRAQQNIYPLIAMNPDDVRQAVADIQSMKRDDWAQAFMGIGDKYMRLADSQASSNREQARRDYLTAQKMYYFGRWPALIESPMRAHSYRKERLAFKAAARLADVTIEEIRADYKGKPVPGLLGIPKGVDKAPLVVILGGLDGWKEGRFTQFSGLLAKGVAILTLDIPGTGESPVKLEKDADQSLVAVLDKALERKDLDGSRVVVYGGSFGGYWATLLAVNLKDRVKGVVTHSGPFDITFHRQQFSSVMKGDEYLFDAYPAMFELFNGIRDQEEFFAKFASQSLREMGYHKMPTADMFVLGGQRDTLVPTEDLLGVMAMPGGIKEGWINPAGIHMGRDRQRGLLDADINTQLVYPWILKKLGVAAN